MVLVQFIEFLSRQHETYVTILPSFAKLCTQLHLEPQIALLAARPLLRAAFDAPTNGSNGAAKEGSAMEVDGAADGADGPLALSSWSLRSKALQTQVMDVLPDTAWQYMTMELYSTFWGLGLSGTLNEINFEFNFFAI